MEQLALLESSLKKLASVVIAFSGGVDSTFLLAVASKVLKDKVLAVTARSSTYPASELAAACELAKRLGVSHLVIDSEELDVPGFKDNPPERCYYCKKELFTKLRCLALEKGYQNVLDGCNLDDVRDYRPGRAAAAELGVISPLKDAGFTKEMIRQLSRELGLPTADKPAYACLASRFPYHQAIDREHLSMVEKAEDFLRAQGLNNFRLRCHGNLARLEIIDLERAYFNNPAQRQLVSDFLRQLGFQYVTIDLEAYRSGRMNEEILPPK